MLLPRYSAANENNRQLVDFPYKKNLMSFCIAATCLLPAYAFLALFAILSLFATCVPTDRLLPCEFNGKMTFSDIYSLKKEVNNTQRKVDEITNVMQYGLSPKSSNTLVQKQNSINETLQALKQKYDNQKTHFAKCYYDNYVTNHNNLKLFMESTGITLPFITIFLFAAIYYYTKKVPVSELNKEQLDAYKALNGCHICWFGTLLIIVCAFVTTIFIPSLHPMREPEDIPVFIAESWLNSCSKQQRTITVEKFLASEASKNNA